jgi:hypothetical protein
MGLFLVIATTLISCSEVGMPDPAGQQPAPQAAAQAEDPGGECAGCAFVDTADAAPLAIASVRRLLPPGATRVAAPIAATVAVNGNTPVGSPAAAPLIAATRLKADTPASPGVSACTTYSIRNAGGPIISHPRVNIIFWGTWASSAYQPIVDEWSALSNMPALYTRLREYGIKNGSWGKRYLYPMGATGTASSPVSLPEATITAAIESLVDTPSDGDVFMVMLPNQYTIATFDGSPNHGHHRNVLYTSGGSSIDLRYGVIPANARILMAHELSETFTDPDFATGSHAWDDSRFGPGHTEVGDPCDPGNQNNHIASYLVRQIWSQDACRCVNERDLNQGDALANGSADETVFRPSATDVYSLNGPAWGFGVAGDILFGGDYDGDGRSEWSMFRPSTGKIFMLNIESGFYTSSALGNTSDTPVPGDYDGDGITDVAVWNATDGWRVQQSSDGSVVTTSWGTSGDIPVAGDYDGDFITDPAVFRPSNGTWYILPSTTPGIAWALAWTATTGDIPIARDFNGDGLTDLAYWHPDSSATLYVDYTNGKAGSTFAYSLPFGTSGDIPVAADYDGDWLADPALFRPSDGTWHIISSQTWTESTVSWGISGDKPLQRNKL